MNFTPLEKTDKTGQTFVIRRAEKADAQDLLTYLKQVSGETPYLIREPEEVTLTLEDEEGFIAQMNESADELLLIATIDGKHVGNCSLSEVGSVQRYRHRCSVAIALYQEYCGRGIGKTMMQVILEEAKNAGYEQAELEVICGNEPAIRLYESLGFETHGQLPNNMKYKDGTYADAIWMMKPL